MTKFRTLHEDEIECRVSRCSEYGANILLYKTARTDMDLLDETVGPENWQDDYKEIKGNLYCGIGIRDKDDKWIWKWNCGIESRADGDGNEKKGEASDAFKRAGTCVGIGRELYTAPEIFVPAAKVSEIKQKPYKDKYGNQKAQYAVYDHFFVERISYDENRRINGLALRNEKTGKRCFVWQNSSSEK